LTKIIDKDKLEYYINQDLSLKNIAHVFNVSSTCISNNCIKYNLKTKNMRNEEIIDLTGKMFGRLTVVRHNGRNNLNRKQCLCRCNCKNKTEINVQTSSLLNGNTKSCGCISSEIIIKRNKDNVKEFTEEEVYFIIQSYVDGNNIKFIENKYDISEYFIKNILHNENIPIREKIIPFNENYFYVIDTGNKAYWLGFLYADGCVSEKALELGLQERDKNHIEKFLEELNADVEIKDRITSTEGKKYKSNRVLLNSKILVSDLIDKGCFMNKSSTIRFPDEDILPKDLQNHFIRGYFDGDGCIGFYKNKIAMIDIISNEPFLLEMQKILVEQCGLNYVKLRKHYTSTKVKYLKYGGAHNVFKIYKYLYKDADVFLTRKYNKFQLFLEFYKSKYNIS